MCHSVLLLDEIIAILSFFCIPNLNNALEIAFALLIYSCEDVLNFFFEFRKWAVSEMDCGQEIHDNFEAIIITNKKVYTFNDFTVSEITNYDAIGSGQHIARALLDIGIVIDKVVAQVCKFDLYCGGEVKVVVIEK